jgi:hypothetical protein
MSDQIRKAASVDEFTDGGQVKYALYNLNQRNLVC